MSWDWRLDLWRAINAETTGAWVPKILTVTNFPKSSFHLSRVTYCTSRMSQCNQCGNKLMFDETRSIHIICEQFQPLCGHLKWFKVRDCYSERWASESGSKLLASRGKLMQVEASWGRFCTKQPFGQPPATEHLTQTKLLTRFPSRIYMYTSLHSCKLYFDVTKPKIAHFLKVKESVGSFRNSLSRAALFHFEFSIIDQQSVNFSKLQAAQVRESMRKSIFHQILRMDPLSHDQLSHQL